MTSLSENWFNSKDSSHLFAFLSFSLSFSLSIYFSLISILFCRVLFVSLFYFVADSLLFSFSLNTPSTFTFYFILALRALVNSPRIFMALPDVSQWHWRLAFFTKIPGFIREKNITWRCMEQSWWGNRDSKCTFRRSTCHAMPGRNKKLHRNVPRDTRRILF